MIAWFLLILMMIFAPITLGVLAFLYVMLYITLWFVVAFFRAIAWLLGAR